MHTEQVADLLHGAAIRLLRFVRKEDAASGITGAQLSILSVLVFAGPRTLGALAAAEQVRAPSGGRAVGASGRLALGAPKPLDRRSVEISATAKGRKLLEAGRNRRLARLSKAIADLPPRQIDLLAQAAGLIVAVTDPSL